MEERKELIGKISAVIFYTSSISYLPVLVTSCVIIGKEPCSGITLIIHTLVVIISWIGTIKYKWWK